MVTYVTMKNWLKQIRDGLGREKEEKSDKGENIASLYEIIEDFLKALDYKQVKGMRDEFLERYEVHREVIDDVIRPRSKKKEAVEPSSEDTVLGLDSEKINEVRETSDIRFRAIEDRIETQSRSLEDKIETRSKSLEDKIETRLRSLEDRLKLKIEGVEKEISETSAHHLELIRLLQQAVHEQNRRIFYIFNRAWLLILGIAVSILIGGAALVIILLK